MIVEVIGRDYIDYAENLQNRKPRLTKVTTQVYGVLRHFALVDENVALHEHTLQSHSHFHADYAKP